MRKLIRGTDKGNAVLFSLVLVIILSSVFISFIPRINATKQYAREYKANVIREIEQSNREIMNQYDLH